MHRFLLHPRWLFGISSIDTNVSQFPNLDGIQVWLFDSTSENPRLQILGAKGNLFGIPSQVSLTLKWIDVLICYFVFLVPVLYNLDDTRWIRLSWWQMECIYFPSFVLFTEGSNGCGQDICDKDSGLLNRFFQRNVLQVAPRKTAW